MGESGIGGGLPLVELRRKVFHLLLGTFFMLLIINVPSALLPAILLLILGSGLSLLHRKWQIPLVASILRHFDREDDRLPGTGIITFFTGVILVWVLFPRDIALAGCAAMTFGDPMASAFGIAFGKHSLPWNRSKSLEGTSALLLTLLFLLIPMYGPLTAVIIALAGAAFEGIRYSKGSLISDNTMIPIGVASVLSLVRIFHQF